MVDKSIFVIGFAAGFFVILEIGEIAWRAIINGRNTLGFEKTDGQFLGLWYFGMLSFCLIAAHRRLGTLRAASSAAFSDMLFPDSWKIPKYRNIAFPPGS